MARSSKEFREKFEPIADLMPSEAVRIMEEALQALQQAEALNSQLQTSLAEKESAFSKLQQQYNNLYHYAYNRSIMD